MPGQKRRTISYRSFVTCDNPKGVECGAIRKTRTSLSPQKKEQQISNKNNNNKIEREKSLEKNQPPSSAFNRQEKKEMRITGFTRDKLDESPSFQLSNLSHDLNHVTNSWPNSDACNRKDEIAQDLLKEVLDLQESLAVLSMLQESSSCKSMRKQKQKVESGRFDDMRNGFLDLNPFRFLKDEKNLYIGYDQSPRVSMDEPPRKSVDEVKNVVRESLLRKNVMKRLDSSSVASTSSRNLALFDSSVSSIASQRRRKHGKGSNLIVKLMGLDSLPSSPKSYKREKVVSLEKPVYDIRSPRARKSQFVSQEMDMRERAFDEILESLNFKGLLRSNLGKGVRLNSSNFADFPSVDERERPPIVVMRPLRFWEDESRGNEDYFLKASSRRGMIQEKVRSFAGASFRDKLRELTSKESSKETWDFSKNVACNEEKVFVNLHEKTQRKKEARRVSEDEKMTPIRRKGEMKKNTEKLDGLNSWDLGMFDRAKMKKQKDEDVLLMNQTFNQKESFPNAMLDYGIKKTLPHRFSQPKKNRQPLSIVVRKKNEADFREEIDSGSENGYTFPTFDSMLINNLNIERWNEKSRATVSDYNADSQSYISDTWESVEYLNNDPKRSYHSASMNIHEDGSETHPDDNQSLLSEITPISISEHCSVAHLDESPSQSALSEVTSVTTHDIGTSTVHLDTNEEGNEDHHHHHLEKSLSHEDFVNGGLRANLKAFLLNSPLFASKAEEIFNLQVNPGSILHINQVDDLDLDFTSPKVLLDCAIELMELRSSQASQVCLPPSSKLTKNPRNPRSLNRFLDDISKGLEDLRCYHNLPSESFSSDHLYALLDRDLRFNAGVWGSGWRTMLSSDEIKQIVINVDKFVLDKLLEEILEDFEL